ncbi:ubiquitin carboxyl-terminal hydrolase 48-like isoform X2 [Rhodnius prolixus]|uniref:ubiquitin carboxyl-terminal hydrolase 48-like isoform X2 n=1 Tax=Rhodnius prolixus TaxID=13249 RepID=UPI003D18ABA1
MPPTKKVHLDKAAWAWCDSVDVDLNQINDENIKSSYRLNVQKCKAGTCRRNCRGNPYCLFGLGEARWLAEPSDESEEEDCDLEIRKPNTFVGLKNLGATCYVNSLLQLWFHNLAFRQAIFSWNPFEDAGEITEMQNGNSTINSPTTVVGHLQLLFALMQFSKQKSIDPLAFIKALRLEPSTQQDAQEFSQLFISLLEDSLKQQSNPSVQNLINNFRGEYSYITRCSKCHKESVSPSLFCELELNVKGHKTLHESIKEFLKEEKLEGVNMYSCNVCMEKQEATRFISLHKLPIVLNLQLMRFIYDRQKGHKKKLNTSIQFPDTLDMSIYLDDSQNERKPLMYNLTAVLIHKGPSAYSGHYIAHICDQTTGTWYKFNDENVEKMEGKKLMLGSIDENEDGVKKVKQPRLAKGYLASSNAYMLVYTAASDQENQYSFEESDLQPHLREQVKKANDAFDALLAETKEQKKVKRVNGKAHREEIAAILKILPVNNQEDQDWDVIATPWLLHWLSNAMLYVDNIDNRKLLCPHGKLHPDQVPNAKYISSKAATVLYEKYGGGPRLQSYMALCKDCVIRKCKSVRLRLRITEDHKDITNLLKQKEDLEGRCFWVGKRSLKVWRRKALLKHLDHEESLGSGDAGADRITAQEICDDVELNSHGFENEAFPHATNDVANGYCVKVEDQDLQTTPHIPDSSVDSIAPLTSDASLPSSASFTILAVLNSVENIIAEIKNKWSESLSTNTICPEMLNDFKRAGKLIKSLYSSTNSVINDVNTGFVSDSVPSVCVSSTTNNNKSLDNGNLALKRKRNENDAKDSGENGDDARGIKSDDEDYDEEFNEDIKCVHGNLIHEVSARRLVSEHIWSKLKWYFPDCTEYSSDSQPCEMCERKAAHGQEALDLHRQQAQAQKDLLPSLLNGKSRPKLVNDTFHVVSAEKFLKPWRKFIKEGGRTEPLHSLRGSSLLCEHGDLMYSLELDQEPTPVVAITKEEMQILSGFYAVDKEVTVTYGPNGEVIDTNPKLCMECMLRRLENEQKALLQYDKAKIYIRQISNKNAMDEPQRNRSPSPRLESKNKCVTSTNTNDMAAGDSVHNTVSQSEAIRRSTRHRRVRGEKEVFMSSVETLRDLKLKILKVLNVAPYDQHLSTEDGRMLVDQTATLASLNIFPNSVLLLRVDEPTEDSSTPDVYISPSEPEEGFKGTVLLKR